MGTNSAYAREGSVVIVHWPLPVRFGTSVTPLGKVVPMKKHRHSCKYSAAVDLKVWFARGAIELPGKESTYYIHLILRSEVPCPKHCVPRVHDQNSIFVACTGEVKN